LTKSSLDETDQFQFLNVLLIVGAAENFDLLQSKLTVKQYASHIFFQSSVCERNAAKTSKWLPYRI